MESSLVMRSLWYEWLVAAIGFVVAAVYIPRLTPHNLLLTILLVIMGVLLEAFPIPLRQLTSSLLIALPIGAMVTYGDSEAIWITAVAGFIGPMLGGRKLNWSVSLFNTGQYALTAYVTTQFFHVVYYPGTKILLDWTLFWSIIFSIVIYLLVNHAFITVLHVLRKRFSFSSVLYALAIDSLHALIALPFTFLMIALSPVHSLLGPTAMLPMIVLSYTLGVHRKTKDVQIVHTVTTNLASQFDIGVICNEVASVAQKLTGADTVVVFTVSEDERTLVPVSVHPVREPREFSFSWPERNGGVVWQAVHEKAMIYVPDTRKDFRVRGIRRNGARYYCSMAAYPMYAHGFVQGVIVCYAERSYAFPYSKDYMMTLAAQASVLLENARLYEELQERSLRDGATGLYNYRYFYEALEKRVNESIRTGKPVSVAILDVDFFKKFNDTYGHMAGDEVLRSLGRLLRDMAGPASVVARYGGEEFALILPMDAADAMKLVEEIRQTTLHHAVEYHGYKLQGITFSSGIASCPEHSTNDRDLLLKADSAMYWGAKQRGRNRTALYTPEFDAQLFVDELTGLYTYHFINIRIREEVVRGVTNWGVVCMDLDHFGYINNAFGFDVGDKVLRHASLLVRESLRQGELACRFGGDEILVLLPNVHPNEIDSIGERLAKAIMSHHFQGTGNVVLSVRVQHIAHAISDITDPTELFDQVGRLFAELSQLSPDPRGQEVSP